MSASCFLQEMSHRLEIKFCFPLSFFFCLVVADSAKEDTSADLVWSQKYWHTVADALHLRDNENVL